MACKRSKILVQVLMKQDPESRMAVGAIWACSLGISVKKKKWRRKEGRTKN